MFFFYLLLVFAFGFTMPHYLALLGHSHIHWFMSKYVKSGNMDVPNAKPKDLSNFEINADELRVGYYGSRGLKFRHIQNEPECKLRLFCQALPQNSLKEAILWFADNNVMESSPLALSNLGRRVGLNLSL